MVQPPSNSSDRRFHVRGLITFLVLLSFAVMAISGVILFLVPAGRIAHATGWSLFGLDRGEWQSLHLSHAIVFLAAGAVHLAVNWRSFLTHLRDRRSRVMKLTWEAAAAIGITVSIMASVIAELPPGSILHDWNRYFRQSFWTESPTAPKPVPPPPASPLGSSHPPIGNDEACTDCHRD